MQKKRSVTLAMAAGALTMLLFLMTAAIEYNRSYQSQVEEAQDRLMLVKLNLESVIAARMVAINGIKAHIDINPHFTQGDFDYFARGIYESSNDVVQSMSFLTDTTLTHIYPYQPYQSIIGTDLGKNPEQRAWIDYAKQKHRAIITAPVNLVEGGVGIIVRLPVIREGQYFGQISIVFDYDKTLEVSGLKSLGESYYVELGKTQDMDSDSPVIWSNFERPGAAVEKYWVSSQVNLYGASLTLTAVPRSGFHGRSPLFYLILAMGVFAALASGLSVYRILMATAVIRRSKAELTEKNDELEAMVNQLRANEEELHRQYEEINLQKEQIKVMADHDYLTELFNRRRFMEDIAQHTSRQGSGTVLLLDLDNFKNINDTQGHHYGDKVLRHIGCLLKAALENDAVAYRIGGDEFAIHLPGLVAPPEIEQSIRVFFAELRANSHIDRMKHHITASVGISRYPEDSTRADELLMKADLAMYQAKSEGKNRYCYFSESMESSLDFSVRIERDLQSALEQDGFRLVYQPIVDTASGEIVSLEALLRIKDSALSPTEFIPVAESSGLIIPIGDWVIEKVCSQIASWRNAGVPVKPVAVNLSAKQLYDGAIVASIRGAMARYGIPPQMLGIEVTESVLIENASTSIELLRQLRELGIEIALDDFGTGYSSLRYLTYMPVDKVKLDKSLKDQFLFMEGGTVMKGLMSVCHGLNLKVVAEGVETPEEYELLKRHGADFAQGYCFERPLDSEAVEEKLKS